MFIKKLIVDIFPRMWIMTLKLIINYLKKKITTNNLSIMSLHNILNFKLIYDAIFNFTKT